MTTTEFGSLGEPIDQTQIRVRKAARCLPRHGLGNGGVVTGATIEEMAAMVFFLEQGSKTELAVLNASGHRDADPVILTADEAEARNTGTGRIYERMSDYLTDGDPD